MRFSNSNIKSALSLLTLIESASILGFSLKSLLFEK